MSTVWKFVLKIQDEQYVQMPRDAQLLSVANQYEAPCLWALVDETAPAVSRRIIMAGTGHPIDKPRPFVGTILMEYGALVLHVFDGGTLSPRE